MNSLHSQMRRFIGEFRGRLHETPLENYHLAWFRWTWCFKSAGSADELAELIVSGRPAAPYEKTWRQYKVTPYPFYEYLDQAGEMGLACAEGHIRRGVMSRAVQAQRASAASAEVVTRCKSNS